MLIQRHGWDLISLLNGFVVDQMQFCSKSDLEHSQIRILISNFPNQNFRFVIFMSEMWLYPKSNLEYSKLDLEHGQVWTLDAPNLIISQIYLDKFGTWSGLVPHGPNQTLSQIYLEYLRYNQIWDIVRFGIIYPKPDHVPNLSR